MISKYFNNNYIIKGEGLNIFIKKIKRGGNPFTLVLSIL
jgi:hypothetical protein